VRERERERESKKGWTGTGKGGCLFYGSDPMCSGLFLEYAYDHFKIGKEKKIGSRKKIAICDWLLAKF
jgi:hypothetical protein